MGFPVLSTVLLAPLLAALVLCFLPRDARATIRTTAAAAMVLALALTLYAYVSYGTATGGMQFTEEIPWIADLGVTYALGIDGLSLPMLLLTDVIGLASVFSSWRIEKRTKEFFILLLVLIAGVTGTFIASSFSFSAMKWWSFPFTSWFSSGDRRNGWAKSMLA